MDGVARFFAVVEMNGPVIEDLIRFMAFTGNDDDVIGLGQFDSAVNGVAALCHGGLNGQQLRVDVGAVHSTVSSAAER